VAVNVASAKYCVNILAQLWQRNQWRKMAGWQLESWLWLAGLGNGVFNAAVNALVM